MVFVYIIVVIIFEIVFDDLFHFQLIVIKVGLYEIIRDYVLVYIINDIYFT